MFASPATESPAMVATASGRNSGSSRVRAAKATNRPLPTMEETKSGPPPPPPPDLTAMPRMIGTTARTAIPARLRRRRKIRSSSEPRNRQGSARADRVEPDSERSRRVGPSSVSRVSATDLEPLSGEGDEDVLQARGNDLEAEDRHADCHQ